MNRKIVTVDRYDPEDIDLDDELTSDRWKPERRFIPARFQLLALIASLALGWLTTLIWAGMFAPAAQSVTISNVASPLMRAILQLASGYRLQANTLASTAVPFYLSVLGCFVLSGFVAGLVSGGTTSRAIPARIAMALMVWPVLEIFISITQDTNVLQEVVKVFGNELRLPAILIATGFIATVQVGGLLGAKAGCFLGIRVFRRDR